MPPTLETHELVFATGNQAKLDQLRFVAEAQGWPVTVVGGRERYGAPAAYDEVGETTVAIARQGALEVAARLGVAVLCEDTALEVDALAGRPGVHAKDYLQRHGRQGLLDDLAGVPWAQRTARVASACCYATPAGEAVCFENVVAAHVALAERFGPYPAWVAPRAAGSSGGGFNAVIVPEGWNKTLAEIAPAEALGWSYRERNFARVLEHVCAAGAAD